MSERVNINLISTCYVCNGAGMIRLNHAAVSSCWRCTQGKVTNTECQTWSSYTRAVADHDPFQNGAHTTWPSFMVAREIDRFERACEDRAFAEGRTS